MARRSGGAEEGDRRPGAAERPRILVLDAYAREGRSDLRAAGVSEAGELYRRRLRELWPGLVVDLGFPADADWNLPAGVSLASYDGIVWTGSSLTVHRRDDVRVERQLAVARRAFEVGVPSFGSCYACQLAVVAAGGRCERNPSGREFGVARSITPSAAGREHPLFSGRPPSFDALASHEDQVAVLPAGGLRLAGNAMSRVQAVEVRHGPGVFWAVQYHPEYDLHELARLAALRSAVLLREGRFPDSAALDGWIAGLEALHVDPERADLAARLALGDEVLDPARRMGEVRRWLEHQVRPRVGARRGKASAS